MSATVKELLKSDSICESYAQMKKGPVFFDSQCIYALLFFRSSFFFFYLVSALVANELHSIYIH